MNSNQQQRVLGRILAQRLEPDEAQAAGACPRGSTWQPIIGCDGDTGYSYTAPGGPMKDAIDQ